jgi:hypothetical protein
MINETKYTIILNDNTFPALYKGKGSPAYTNNPLEARTYTKLEGILKLIHDYNYFNRPCTLEPQIVTISINQKQILSKIETTFEIMSLEDTYSEYREYLLRLRKKWVTKNPGVSVEFEEIPLTL